MYFQNLPMSPNIRPISPEMRPNAVKVMESPTMNNKEKVKDFFKPVVSLYPATTLIIRGIIASTQGLDAVVMPPMKTAITASQGLC